jgi:hypothetical protein
LDAPLSTLQRKFICIQLFKNPIADMSNAKNQGKLLNRKNTKKQTKIKLGIKFNSRLTILE